MKRSCRATKNCKAPMKSLDTAKEELQSTNEELNTVNEELQGRNEELSRVNSDLVNLLGSVQIAIVMVAGDLRIRRFTPMARARPEPDTNGPGPADQRYQAKYRLPGPGRPDHGFGRVDEHSGARVPRSAWPAVSAAGAAIQERGESNRRRGSWPCLTSPRRGAAPKPATATRSRL